MKPIRLTTIGKIIWFFLIIVAVILVVALASLLKKEEPKKVDKPTEIDSEKIIDYTDSKNYLFDFDKNEGFTSKNDVISITESGTYKLTGKNNKYKILIDSNNSIVKLILSSFNTDVVYDLINIKNASRVLIELEGENSIVSDLLEQEGTINPKLITSNANIEFIGNGSLRVETIGDFINSKKDVTIKNSILELNSINNGISTDGSFTLDNGTLYIFSSNKGLSSGGNITIDNGNFVIRSSATALKNKGLFIINSGQVFVASMDEIQKPNANSLQKSIILNFKEARKSILIFHDTTKAVLAYSGGEPYKHILYSAEFESEGYVLYGNGKLAGTQTYGIYKIEDAEEEEKLTCENLTNDMFIVNDLVNVYNDIVKK